MTYIEADPLDFKKQANGLAVPFGQLFFTGFADQAATKKAECRSGLAELAAFIKTKREASKAELPWIKLAKFGDTPTDKGCLRHDANVTAITGVEGDYDAKPKANGSLMSLTEAATRLREAEIVALLYETPSSTPEVPHWRVLAPTAQEYQGDKATLRELRERFLARLNGVLGGVLASESFVLSQSYYFGNVDGKPDIRTEVCEGWQRVDQLDDTGAIYKNGSNQPEERTATEPREPREDIPLNKLTETLSWIDRAADMTDG